MKKKINYPKPPCSIGQMMYPFQMGLNFWNKSYWGVITKINLKTKGWKEIRYFTCYDCARIYSERITKENK